MSEDKEESKVSFDESGFSFNIGGLSSGKIAIIFAAISTVVGSLWAGFQVYQQFLTMQEVTATYASMGDEFNKMKERQDSNERMIRMNLETTKYLSDNLAALSSSVGSSVMSTRQTVDAVTARTQVSERETLQSQRAIIQELRAQDVEQQRRVKELEKQLEDRITKTLANPLAERGE
jgi:hypothetical protein